MEDSQVEKLLLQQVRVNLATQEALARIGQKVDATSQDAELMQVVARMIQENRILMTLMRDLANAKGKA
jgi:hypothetical protein